MREKKLASLIKESLKKDFLYSEEELHHLKKELKRINEIIISKQDNFKGFGWFKYHSDTKNLISDVDLT